MRALNLNLIEKHFRETESLVRAINRDVLAGWLINEGFFPEQYVFPPNFQTSNFSLKPNPYYSIKIRNGKTEFDPKLSSEQVLNISYPKSELTDRIFGVYSPKYYHDIVWYIHKHWKQILNHLFRKKRRIYSFSFPIPVNENSVGQIGKLRSGRMIYEYLELAERALLAESYKYRYLLKTDIKNFYPSIYSHSVSWAIHTKEKIRDGNERNLRLCGNILDQLIQYANDRKTNGIPIGPAISDLIAEIILAPVDVRFTQRLYKEDFIAARYKDDYFFLIKTDAQADLILKELQAGFKEFNLFINEEKTKKYSLPDGFLRPWMHEYNKLWNTIQPDSTKKLSFNNFLIVAQEVLKLDELYPGTQTISKFLSKLTNKSDNYSLHISFDNIKNQDQAILRVLSFLMHLSIRNKKAFPAALGVIESVIRAPVSIIPVNIKEILINELKIFSGELINSPDEHKKLWWIYFVLSNSILKAEIDIGKLYNAKSPFLDSLKNNRQEFYSNFTDCQLFNQVIEKVDYPIAKHLDIFDKP